MPNQNCSRRWSWRRRKREVWSKCSEVPWFATTRTAWRCRTRHLKRIFTPSFFSWISSVYRTLVCRSDEKSESDAYSRTLITFTEEDTFHDVFHQEPRAPPVKPICPVTRLPARYFDPVTKTAYANTKAFKVLREAYQRQVDDAENRHKTKP